MFARNDMQLPCAVYEVDSSEDRSLGCDSE